MSEGKKIPIAALELSSLWHGTQTMFVTEFADFQKQKNTCLKAVCKETVHYMAKSWPRENQSECSDLLQDYLVIKKTSYFI